MDKNEAIKFLFAIGKEIKRSFESPVILVTFKDYADGIYRSLVDIRAALVRRSGMGDIADIINNFHLDWMRATREIEEFKKRAKDTPREVIQDAIDHTIKCVHNRYANFKNFQYNLKPKMTIEDRLIMQADLEIMKEMKETVTAILEEKKTCFKYNADQIEFLVKLNFEIDELLNWIDRLYDNLALVFCKVVHVQIPQLASDLSKTLKQVIDEVTPPSDIKNTKILEKPESKGKLLCSMVRINASHDLEVSKVIEKIKVLEERIEKLKEEDSSAVMALQHKVIYLEERLQSLANLKKCMNALKEEQSKEIGEDDVLYSTELHIFNHNLPFIDRGRLIERLLKLWDFAVSGDDTGKSIISILSAADFKEVFTDDIGQFTVDEYGRKLYATESDTVCQLNERNELVPVNDDDQHIYFYDDCGRYYLSDSRTHIYKAHENASEYELAPAGKLLKIRETVDGIEYKYDNNGRYHVNELGQKIYCDMENGERYEQDGFGNLVRIHSARSLYETCSAHEPMHIKESSYLKEVVGDALKKCLVNVLLHQPADPIGFLADCLEKYWENVEEGQKRQKEKEALAEERHYAETVCAPDQSYVTEEQSSKSSFDYDLQNYTTMTDEQQHDV